MRSITVTFDDGNIINTSMAAHVTDDQIKEYYRIGRQFNIGDGPDFYPCAIKMYHIKNI